MKNIPDIITAIRIVLSFMLLFFEPLSTDFLLIYIFAGVSDMLDGFLARKIKNTNKFGATLDSIADAVFAFVLLFIFIPYFQWETWIICWVVLITLLRLVSLLIGFLRFRQFAFLHTYANKLTGLALFGFPLWYMFFGLTGTAIILCIIATISAIEELIINIKSSTLKRDITSIFAVSRNYK